MKNIIQKKSKVKTRLFSLTSEIGLLAVTISISILIIIFIRINFSIHMDHLNFSLKQQSIIDSDASSINLFVRFINQKRLYDRQITRDHFDIDEAFLMFSSVDEFRDEFSNILPEYNILEKISIYTINGLKKITGKPPLPSEKDLTAASMISNAKYYEQQKNYFSAIIVYDNIIEKNINARLTSTALLNRALCFAFMGDFVTSKANLNEIIERYSSDNISVTASILLKYLDEFLREKEIVLQSNIEDLERGERLSNLLQFELALSILDTIKPTSKDMEANINYYRGISYEELGEKEKAVESYVKSIEKGGVSDVSKIANRRLLMVGSQMESKQGDEVRKVSRRINTVLNDDALDIIEKVIPQRVTKEEIKEEEEDITYEKVLVDTTRSLDTESFLISDVISSTFSYSIDSIMSMLNQQQTEIQTKDSLETVALKEAQLEELKADSLRKLQKMGPRVGDRVIVETRDNRAFIGQLLSDPNSPIIRLQTLIGLIGIQSSDIKSVNKLD